MRHRKSASFDSRLNKLPNDIQTRASKAFDLLKQNPKHPSLNSKNVGDFWSARMNDDYRCLALSNPEGFDWVWIGSHAEYEKLIK